MGEGGIWGKNYNTMTVIKLSSLTVIKLFQFIYVIHTMWFDSSDFDLPIPFEFFHPFSFAFLFFDGFSSCTIPMTENRSFSS